jgi:hypothetical protein
VKSLEIISLAWGRVTVQSYFVWLRLTHADRVGVSECDQCDIKPGLLAWIMEVVFCFLIMEILIQYGMRSRRASQCFRRDWHQESSGIDRRLLIPNIGRIQMIWKLKWKKKAQTLFCRNTRLDFWVYHILTYHKSVSLGSKDLQETNELSPEMSAIFPFKDARKSSSGTWFCAFPGLMPSCGSRTAADSRRCESIWPDLALERCSS